MSAFMIASARIKDTDLYIQYSELVSKIIRSYGGEAGPQSHKPLVLAGEGRQELLSLIKFPDMNTLKEWFASDDYQALIPMREKAAEITLIAYEH